MRAGALAVGFLLFVVALGAGPMEARACTPDSGFEWCYDYSYGSAYCKIQVDTNYNDAWINGYHVAPVDYIMRFKCNGTTFYGPNAFSCGSGGCGSENLGGGTVSKAIAHFYNDNAQMQNVSCWNSSGGYWCYAGYNPWSSGIKVVECYNDTHCACGKTCSVSGVPSNWKCVTKTESCNGVDDDCDGLTDEEGASGCATRYYDNDADTYGVTGNSKCLCAASGKYSATKADDCNDSDASIYPTATEKCDSKDNDCDASTDEGFNIGAACTVGVGQCSNTGVNVCKADQTGAKCSVDALLPQAEVCDGLDNDCNGVNDNGFDVGAVCSVGIGECTNVGLKVCKVDKSGTQCSAIAFLPTPEKCDAKDNDCDAATDEGFDKGAACTVGVGECKNSGQKVCTSDGTGTKCGVDPLPAIPEKCDAKDNDCDGSVDEDFLLGKPCSVGVGVCVNLGLTICAPNGIGTTCDASPLPSSPEKCDALDNDCDGLTDEGFDLQALCQVGVGECKNTGLKVCTADGLGTKCSVDPLPATTEKCDAKDNDCDGQADEGFDLGAACTVGIGQCAQSGQKICSVDGSTTTCSAVALPPQVELCDALDNDCDGKVDETFDLGASCTVGVGQCTNTGVKACRNDGFGTECNVSPLPPTTEKCNGLDDDCDAAVDNGFDKGAACTVGVGECKNSGLRVCTTDGTGTQCGVEPLAPKPEVCDSKDNDCDAAVDNGFDVGKACSVGVGECVNEGSKVCTANGTSTVCSATPLPPKLELCDAKDNDCDGKTDEVFDVGAACTVGVGQCTHSGDKVCREDGLGTECGVQPLPATPETCNGLDDDCDGQADNGFQIKKACTVGIGECTAAGLTVCTPDGSDIQCDAQPLPASPEVCDGKDNDCDGQVDQSFPVGDGCTNGIGTCEAQGKLVCTADHLATVCDAEPFPPVKELCDGLDNDCDGVPDDDFPLGSFCLVGIGECQNSGQLLCSQDGLGTECDVKPFAPQLEACDGLDNDCDDEIDEDYALWGECAVGIGECANAGITVCTPDGFGTVCNVEPLPMLPEVCDGLDNDCDAAVDNGFDVGQACSVGVGECVNEGARVCAADGASTVCSAVPLAPKAELCDAKDNDCDGSADENYALGESCTVGTGQCENSGVTLCAADGLGTECSASPLPAGGELCDGKDNDCDGTADENYGLGQPCAVGVGECVNGGVNVCAGTLVAVVCSVEPLPPSDEVCDGKDNDCNGTADDGFDVGADCTTGIGECAVSGQLVCAESLVAAVCSAVAAEPAIDVCDGKDNDCDGTADEDYPVGDPCTVGMGECVAQGKLTCMPDGTGTACSTSPGDGKDEWCDGLDNDCDGEVDEEYPLGVECTAGLGECLASGLYGCNPAGDDVECVAELGLPAEELCDGKDNDCNGQTDEPFEGLGGVCHAGAGLCAADGMVVCGQDGAGTACDAVAGEPADEACNLVDDDCDGTFDESCPCLAGEMRACGAALGECVAGVQVCGVAGTWGDCVASLGPQPETCDGKDNDCDGVTDPGCPCADGVLEPCGSEVGECVAGARTCLDGVWGDCLDMSGPSLELCDGLDNDCNGQTDELFPSLGLPCEAGVGACLAQGTMACAGDGLAAACDAVVGASVDETCNQVDDDCDGEVDEAPACFDCTPGATTDCVPDGDCAEGQRTCTEEGAWSECVPSPGCGQPEGEADVTPEVVVEPEPDVTDGEVVTEDVPASHDGYDKDHWVHDDVTDANPPQLEVEVGGEGLGGDAASDVVGADEDGSGGGAASSGCSASGRGPAPLGGALLLLALLGLLASRAGRRNRITSTPVRVCEYLAPQIRE